jgi:hypothetical protein
VPGDPLLMLSRFFGPQRADLVFMPNICYPTSETLGFRDGKRLVCIDPPPIAWGNNAPWPFDDTPADTPRDAFSAYAKILLGEMFDANPEAAEAARKVKLPVPNTFISRHPDWFDQFAVLFVSGVTALYLRETFNAIEAKAYTMMVHKAHGFEALASVIDVLDKYLESQAAGKYATFIEYLPTFTKAMRVAEGLKKVIMISGDLAARLREAAEQAHLEVEEYLEKVLEREDSGEMADPPSANSNQVLVDAAISTKFGGEEDSPPPPNTAQAHVYAAKRAKSFGTDPTISSRSREIIEEEMEKHLMRRDDDSNEPIR